LRNTGPRILKNATTRLLNQSILVVSSFVVAISLARLWGAESYGRYAFAIAFAELFTFSFDWGLHWLLTREVARDKKNVAKYLDNALTLTIVLSLGAMGVLVLLINLPDYPPETVLAVYLAGIWTLLEVLSSLFIWGTFYAFERMEYETPPLLAERLFAVIGGLAVIAARRGLLALMLVLVVSRVIKLAVCVAIYTRRIGPVGLGFDWQFWRGLARSTFPFGLNLAFGLIYARSSITMLSLLRGDEAEIGFFRAALACAMYWPEVGLSLTTSLFPMMSAQYQAKREAFVLNYQRSIRWLAALGVPIAVGLWLLADRLVILLYGEGFMPAVVSLRILSLSVLLKFIHGALAMVLTSSNRQELRMSIMAFAALANIVMNLVLIPWKGYVGASVAAGLTDGLILVTTYFFVARQLGGLPALVALARPAMSAIVMSVYVIVFRRMSLFVLIPTAAIIDLAVLYALGGLPRDELAQLKGLFPERWVRWVAG
jgi:O-antigen/teichoic acid export membrane protein